MYTGVCELWPELPHGQCTAAVHQPPAHCNVTSLLLKCFQAARGPQGHCGGAESCGQRLAGKPPHPTIKEAWQVLCRELAALVISSSLHCCILLQDLTAEMETFLGKLHSKSGLSDKVGNLVGNLSLKHKHVQGKHA